MTWHIFLDDGPLLDDLEGYLSYTNATDAAHEWWGYKCEDDGISIGEEREITMLFKEGYWNEDGAFILTGAVVTTPIVYEAEKSDYEEHFNQGNYL